MAEEQPKPIFEPRKNPCPICGGTLYTWGVTVGEKPGARLYTRAYDKGWGEGKVMVTRECNTCGNVQLFTEDYSADG